MGTHLHQVVTYDTSQTSHVAMVQRGGGGGGYGNDKQLEVWEGVALPQVPSSLGRLILYSLSFFITEVFTAQSFPGKVHEPIPPLEHLVTLFPLQTTPPTKKTNHGFTVSIENPSRILKDQDWHKLSILLLPLIVRLNLRPTFPFLRIFESPNLTQFV